MAINSTPAAIPYPPNTRPPRPEAGLLAGAPALVRIGQMRQNASLRLSQDAWKVNPFNPPAGGTMRPTFGSILREVISPTNFLKTMGLSALLSFPLAAIADFMDLRQGNITQQQFVTDTITDGCAYTLTGTLSSLVGAVVGSLIPIPFVGTAIGMAGGVLLGSLLGKLYDDQIRPQLTQSLASSPSTPITTIPSPAPAPTAP